MLEVPKKCSGFVAEGSWRKRLICARFAACHPPKYFQIPPEQISGTIEAYKLKGIVLSTPQMIIIDCHSRGKVFTESLE